MAGTVMAGTVMAGAGEAADGKPRRTLSLRARLLAGLIALTACFLIVMGLVSAVVLSTLEHNQFDDSLRLAVREPISAIAEATAGFSASYYSFRTSSWA